MTVSEAECLRDPQRRAYKLPDESRPAPCTPRLHRARRVAMQGPAGPKHQRARPRGAGSVRWEPCTFIRPVAFDPNEISVLAYVQATAVNGKAPLESADVRSRNQNNPPARTRNSDPG